MTGITSQGGKPPGNPPQTTARNSQGLLLCSARWSRAIVFETQGGTRNRTRDLPKKGSAFITSSDHWTGCEEFLWPEVMRNDGASKQAAWQDTDKSVFDVGYHDQTRVECMGGHALYRSSLGDACSAGSRSHAAHMENSTTGCSAKYQNHSCQSVHTVCNPREWCLF